jgi:hypothetical protein
MVSPTLIKAYFSIYKPLIGVLFHTKVLQKWKPFPPFFDQ